MGIVEYDFELGLYTAIYQTVLGNFIVLGFTNHDDLLGNDFYK